MVQLKTLIISAFPGCGKSYLANTGNNSHIFIDKDNGFLKTNQDFSTYAQEVIELIGHADFIFINQYPEVLEILHSQGYKYIIIAPNNLPYLSSKARKLIKQQWFGRFSLRGNDEKWISILKQNYDQWTTLNHLESMHPSKIVLLNENEYLTDIVDDLVIIKDTIWN